MVTRLQVLKIIRIKFALYVDASAREEEIDFKIN